ncbi:MAG: type II secretion system protein M [Deltaproteobacteria bacterium]|nr:type II secretion system protein M [Deltaproteobacteria bacterium]
MKITRSSMLIAAIAGLLVVGLLYYWLIISPAISQRERLISRIEKRAADLVQMKALKREWQDFQKKRDAAETRLKQKGSAFTLLSFLEALSRSVGVDKKIQYMKPLSLEVEGEIRPEGIEMVLEKIDMRELVSFLYRIEYSEKLLTIRRIKIQKSSRDKNPSLKVTLQIYAYLAV